MPPGLRLVTSVSARAPVESPIPSATSAVRGNIGGRFDDDDGTSCRGLVARGSAVPPRAITRIRHSSSARFYSRTLVTVFTLVRIPAEGAFLL